jgi:hypothetical protein
LSKRDGLDPDEKVINYEECDFLKHEKKGRFGTTQRECTTGELVLTQKGLIFLEATGFLKTSRRRIHSYTYDDIQSFRMESRGAVGASTGTVFVAVSLITPKGEMTVRYIIRKGRAVQIIQAIEKMRKSNKTPGDLRSQILRRVKPKGEVSLHEIAKDESLRDIIVQITKAPNGVLSTEMVLKKVIETVEGLITDGELDGIVTDDGKFISNTMLARKTVQYQVVIDFTSLFSQLETKGIVLETIECPSCGGKLDYPESGSTVQCKFCDSTVSAVDLFEKFKSLL